MDVNLYVQGTRDEITETLSALQATLGRDLDVTIWRDHRIGDLVDLQRWEGPVTVEVHSRLVTNRASAIAVVGGAVTEVDPDYRVITGGDVFLRPMDD